MQEGDTVPRRDRESVFEQEPSRVPGTLLQGGSFEVVVHCLKWPGGNKSSAAHQPEDLEPKDPDRREFYAMQHRPTKARNCKSKELL